MSNRPKVPIDIEASVLFKAEHKCSICQHDSVQVAHIDRSHNNNKESNLMTACPNHHADIDSKSPIKKGYTKQELKKYKRDWESRVRKGRSALKEFARIALLRFDGPDVNTVYLEIRPGVLRGFQDPNTLQHLGFNWGDVDVFLEEDKQRFKIEDPLKKLSECKKIRLIFQNGAPANEIYIIWDDGKRHHIPDPYTLDSIGGSTPIDLNNKEFNAIPHGAPLKSIFEVNTNLILKEAMDKRKT